MTNFFIDLFNMSVTASYLVLAVVIVRLILKNAPKWVNCLLWAFEGLRLICPFSIESGLSLIPGTKAITVNESSVGRPFSVQSGVSFVDASVNNYIGDNYYEGVTVPTNTFSTLSTILAVVWLVGLFAMLLYGLISFLKLKRRVGASLQINKNGDVFYCDNIDTPFILGFLKPKIYIPSGITDEQLNYIILHEKAHLKRRDHFWKPLGYLLLSVYWFNPVIWVAYILLCRDIESACDEKVIKNMAASDKKGYSETLFSCSVKRRMIMACPLAFGEVSVKQRIKSVLNYKKPAFWIIVLAILLITVVAVCFLTNPGGSSSVAIIGGADGPTAIFTSLKKDKLDKILSEDGYKVISAEEKKISIQFMSGVLTDKMFEKDGTYRVRSRDIIQDSTIVSLKKVVSSDDYFVFNFDVSYDDIPEKGTVYVINANQFDGGLELGDEITVSDPFGAVSEGSIYRTYCTSQGPKREFSFQVPKEWFENRRDNKIMLSFDAWVVNFQEADYVDEAEGKNYTYATSNTGAFCRIKENYYSAVINENAEYQETGLYFFETDGDARLIAKLGGTIVDSLLVENTFYYIENEHKLYSVELKEEPTPHLLASGLYGQDKDYSIEKIISADSKYIYCRGRLYGVREDYPDWDYVYLKISRTKNEFSEVSKNDIPVDESQIEDILGNVESTLNTDIHTIHVKSYRVKFSKNGSIESAIFNAWVPGEKYDETKPGTECNIMVTDDYSVFYNVINEEITLSVYGNSTDKPLPRIYEVMKQVEESIEETKNNDTNREYYVLSAGDESVFSVNAGHDTEPVLSETKDDEPPENVKEEPETQENEIIEIQPPKTTAFVDYFTPDGEYVIEYVG